MNSINSWEVLEQESMSDHNYIITDIKQDESTTGKDKQRAWKTINGPINETKLRNWIKENLVGKEYNITQSIAEIKKAYKNCVTKIKVPEREQCPYWWTVEIHELREKNTKSRRKMLRIMARRPFDEEVEESQSQYKEARKKLRHEINVSKKKCWKEMIDSVEDDPWGQGYQVAMKSIKHKI